MVWREVQAVDGSDGTHAHGGVRREHRLHPLQTGPVNACGADAVMNLPKQRQGHPGQDVGVGKHHPAAVDETDVPGCALGHAALFVDEENVVEPGLLGTPPLPHSSEQASVFHRWQLSAVPGRPDAQRGSCTLCRRTCGDQDARVGGRGRDSEAKVRIEHGDPKDAPAYAPAQRLPDKRPDPRGIQLGVEETAGITDQPFEMQGKPPHAAVLDQHRGEVTVVGQGERLKLTGGDGHAVKF